MSLKMDENWIVFCLTFDFQNFATFLMLMYDQISQSHNVLLVNKGERDEIKMILCGNFNRECERHEGCGGRQLLRMRRELARPVLF